MSSEIWTKRRVVQAVHVTVGACYLVTPTSVGGTIAGVVVAVVVMTCREAFVAYCLSCAINGIVISGEEGDSAGSFRGAGGCGSRGHIYRWVEGCQLGHTDGVFPGEFPCAVTCRNFHYLNPLRGRSFHDMRSPCPLYVFPISGPSRKLGRAYRALLGNADLQAVPTG
eukprot:3985961-Pyramimonas_sp.AAC.2